ncbi:hypothetical protein Leryth_015370 [Lithospermum erythrorhizon]|nr:hypothetical protein Leryth_015370 [Lithospermum erythrorhizon]
MSSKSTMSEAATRSPEIRKDPIHNRWVIFSPTRSRRPSDFKSKTPNPNPNPNPSCPFCIGNEHECAPEIFRVPEKKPEWNIRVIQNLFPALNRDIEQPMGVGGGGEVVVGFGFHDVVIEAPVHWVQLVDLAPEEIGVVLLAYKNRILQLLSFHSIRYVQVFKNHGASAGASMSHSHSQIIGLPVVPSLVSARVKSMKEYYEQTGKCSLCEIQSKQLLVDESTHFTSVAPFASAWPFELWIIPREHSSHFHEIDSDKVVDLGGLLKLMLQKISLQLNNPPYNFMIHTSPVSADSSSLSSIHWFVQIIPQLSTTAGFELGTGCYINPIFPEDAAKVLREVRIPKVDSE